MTCTVDGCARPVKTRGYCGAHYLRVWKNGDHGPAAIAVRPAPLPADATCTVDGCDLRPVGRGLCRTHYARLRTKGDPGPAATGTDVARRLTPDQIRERMGASFQQIHDPVRLAYRCLHDRGLVGHRDEAELLGVALTAIVDAVLSWDPHGGAGVVTWAYRKMHSRLSHALQVERRHRDELGRDGCVSDEPWLYRSGTDWYDRIELRVDLQRWADLAELTAYQRFLVEWAAVNGRGVSRESHRVALRHLRTAAVTGRRRDDQWARRARVAAVGA